MVVNADCVLVNPKGEIILKKKYRTEAHDLQNALSKVLNFLQQIGRIFEFDRQFQKSSLYVINWNSIRLRTEKGDFKIKCLTSEKDILKG